MYDFTDGGDNVEDVFGDSAEYQTNVEADREWDRMSNQFTNAGYREGITAGKESALQGGFDLGFANIGAPIGRELGNLRGLSASALSLLESSRPIILEQGVKDGLLTEVREIIRGLSRLQFENLAPPDEEALAHAQEHAEMNGADPQNSVDSSTARTNALSELSGLRQRLEKALGTLRLDSLFPSLENTTQPFNIS